MSDDLFLQPGDKSDEPIVIETIETEKLLNLENIDCEVLSPSFKYFLIYGNLNKKICSIGFSPSVNGSDPMWILETLPVKSYLYETIDSISIKSNLRSFEIVQPCTGIYKNLSIEESSEIWVSTKFEEYGFRVEIDDKLNLRMSSLISLGE